MRKQEIAPGARLARDSAGLLVGTLINGVFAYVFFVLATRGLGASAAAPVAVLWTYWGIATAVITFPVQHWIIAKLGTSGENAVAQALPRMWVAVSALAVAATAVSWLVDDQLFGHEGAMFSALVGFVTIGAFFTGLVRGGLAGRDRFAATSAALAAENIVRVVLAVAVLRAGGGAVGLGIVLVAGGVIGLVWPSGYRFRRTAGSRGDVSSLSFLGTVAAGSLLGQLILVGGPAVVALLGGAPRSVTMLFATFALFRAPYLVAVGLANRLTGTLTGWIRSQRLSHVRRFHILVIALTVGGGLVAAVAAYAVGPALVGAVFGHDTNPPRWVAAVIASGSIVAVGNLALALLAIARGQGRHLTWSWVIGAGAVVVVLAALPQPPVGTVSWAFLAGEATAFGMLLWNGWGRALPTREPEPEPELSGGLPPEGVLA